VAMAQAASAAIDEAIWEIKVQGVLGIQDFTSGIQPRLQSAGFKTKDFMRIVLGRTPATSESLALTIQMRGGTTNMFLSVFDRISRQNTVRLTTGETTVVLADNKNLSFSMAGQVLPFSTSRGGRVRLAGRGRVVEGIPAGLRANVGGLLVDGRPGDLGGTTGVVLRATMSTGKLLRP
jgi:hypothetical protein